MDPTAFDRFARSVARSTSRRTALGALLGGLLAALPPGSDSEGKSKQGKTRKRGAADHSGGASRDGKDSRPNRKKSAHHGRGASAEVATNCCGAKACAPPAAQSDRASCTFAGQTFTNLRAEGTNASKIDGQKMIVAGGNWRRVNFSDACLQGAVFTNQVDIRSASFRDACLVDADLSGAIVDTSVDFGNAVLCRTKLPANVGLDPNRDCGRGTASGENISS